MAPIDPAPPPTSGAPPPPTELICPRCRVMVGAGSSRYRDCGASLLGDAGLTNDLIRIGLDHLGISLSTAAIPLLLGALATPIAAWWLGRWWLRQRTSVPPC